VFAISAFAASLKVEAGTLQAGDDAIDQCVKDPGGSVDVSYGEAAYDSDGEFAWDWTIGDITLDHGGDCPGLAYQVVVADSTGTSLAEQGGTFDTDETVETVKVEFNPGFDAEAATDVHLVIRNASN
jgi:hypothetical protein